MNELLAVICLIVGILFGIMVGFMSARDDAVEAGAACYQHEPNKQYGTFDWLCDGAKP